MAAKVYFDPPLWLQRQSWVLSQLRHEKSSSVVDVGCSNGVLLSALMQPAFQLDHFPVERFPALKLSSISGQSSSTDADDDDHDNDLLSKRHWIYSPNDIVLSRLIGIDIERKALENAKSGLSLHGLALAKNRPRWKSLDVRLFQGPLEMENETLDDYDAFVATEVIEHLHEDALQKFAPTILGKYRPRVVLITTPNYCFNANFGGDLTTRPGFPDPTGRTNRVFRHDDHKFEFTPDEFRQWCEGIADDYGYDVQIHGIGAGIYRPDKKDADSSPQRHARASLSRTTANSDLNLQFASQGAVFTRQSVSSRGNHQPSNNFDSSHPFSDKFVKTSLPKPLADTDEHDIFDEAVRRKGDVHHGGDEDDEDRRGREGRRARSRRPENLPFLSSPSPQLPVTPSPPSQAAPNALGLSSTLAFDMAGSAPPTPFSGHHLVWSHRYPCPLEEDQVKETGKRKMQSAVPLPVDEILSTVIERQRQLYVDAQWNADYSATRDEEIGKQAVTQLWDVWSDDECRAACGGRIADLFDALRLVAHEPVPLSVASDVSPTDSNKVISGMSVGVDEHAASDAPTHKSVIVGSDGAHWDLRVQTTRHSNQSSSKADFVDSDLYLVYTHPDVAQWQSKIDEAKRWVPKQFASSSRKTSASQAASGPTGSQSGAPIQADTSIRAPSWD